MKYTEAKKKKFRAQIRREIKQGTFSADGFSNREGMDVKTLRRWISQDKKLLKLVTDYNIAKACAEREARDSRKEEKRTGRSQKPFTTTQVEDEKDEEAGTSVITTRSLDVKTIEDALRIAEVDRDIWEVERSKVNSWEVTIGKRSTGTGQPETYTNFQVTVWLRRIAGPTLALKNLVDKIQAGSPIVPVINYKRKKVAKPIERELEISLCDIHLGLRAFAGDSDVDWNLFDAEKMSMEILEELIRLSEPYGPFDRVIFPFGNDFLHCDNVYSTTTAGTVQPEADAWKQTLLRGELLAIALIERCKEIAPVKVISVPGNHAMHTEITMSRILHAWYHADQNVEVDAGFSSFKFHSYGLNLIGFEHGHSIRQTLRLAGLMANSCRRQWEKARYCEWHLGDQHRKGSGRPSAMAEQGVSVEFLPSLCPANSWHKIHAFNFQKRAGMCFVWDKSAGPIARLQANIDSYTSKLMR